MSNRLEQIEEALETYGLGRILEDAQITLPEALDILDELGFVCLDCYDGLGDGDNLLDGN